MRIVAREGQLITVPSGINAASARDALLRATANLPFDVFRMEKRGLRAGRAVGLIEVGRLQVELLPKIQGQGGDAQDREFLMNLLSEVGLAPRLTARAARIAPTNAPFLEAVIEAFSQNLLSRLRRGLPRRYAERAEELSVLRGRVDFTRLATRRPGHGATIPVRHAPLYFDNPLSRLLRATVQTLLIVSRSSKNRARLRACDALLVDASAVPLTRQLVEQVEVTRYELEWRDAIDIAAALARRGAVNPLIPGLTRLQGLLFSLDDLFESLLRRDLVKALAGSQVALAHRSIHLHLLQAENGAEFLTLKPDYLFADRRQPEDRILVGDAKWKALSEAPGLGLVPGDVYQLTTYMSRHAVGKGVLFFPLQPWMAAPAVGRGWARDFRLAGGGGSIRVGAVDVHGLVSRNRERRVGAIAALREIVLGAAAPKIPAFAWPMS